MYECTKCGFRTCDKTEIDSLKKLSILEAENKKLKAACEVAVLAMTHKPINPDDVSFVKTAIAAATVTPNGK